MITYFTIVFLSILLAVKAEKRNSKKYLFWAIILISLLSGLRDVSVGTDTKTYFRIFNNIANGYDSSLEIGFVYLSKVLLMIFKDARALFIIYAFATNILIVGRLWSLRKYCNFGAMFFFYITIYFPQSMNILRQYLALAIVFFATKFIEERKYLWYVICNLIAVSIHISSAVGLMILLLWLLIVDDGRKIRKITVFLSIFVLSPLVLLFLEWIYSNYMVYTEETNVTFSFLIVGRILALLFFVFVRLLKGNPFKNIESPANYSRYVSWVYTLGILVTTIGFVYEFIGRISLYFIIFEIPFASRVSLKEKNDILKICYIFLALYFLIVKTFIMKEVEVIPYKFFWLA